MKTLKLFLAACTIGLFVFACGNETAEKAENALEGAVENAEGALENAEGALENAAESAETVIEEVTNEFIENPTTVEWAETEFNYGEVDAGEVVEHIFSFTNTGENPLLISNAKGSCGCTVPSYPEEPIPPGGKGEILVKFDSKGKNGDQRKNVTVTANTNPPQSKLFIAGKVNGTPPPPVDASAK